jgi:hypothetical protein
VTPSHCRSLSRRRLPGRRSELRKKRASEGTMTARRHLWQQNIQ